MKNFLFLMLIISCSRVQTLNTERRLFGKKPSQVLWLQLAGFSDEQLPLIKFSTLNKDEKYFYEDIDCAGRMWNYSLFQLRPNSNFSFLSQMLGSKNVSFTCKDLEKTPFWENYKKEGYQISIIENEVEDKYSLENFFSCQNSSFVDLTLFKMAKSQKNSDASYFHYQDNSSSQGGKIQKGVLFDKACQKETCYSTVLNNLKYILENKASNDKEVFIIRDNAYLNALASKNLDKAKEILLNYNKFLKWYYNEFKSPLIIVSGASPILLEFPNEGKDWENYFKKGNGVSFKNTSLVSPIIAKGPLAENFCGSFDETDLKRRLNFKTPFKEFQWDNLVPFED